MARFEQLLQSNKCIFTTDDLMVLWNVSDRRDVIESVKDYVRRGRLFSPRRGIYSLREVVDPFELAQKLIFPSYISYYTALASHGIVFQQYSEVHSIASYSKKIRVGNRTYFYHKLKADILMQQVGLIKTKMYTIASAERAVCDSLVLNPKVAFDNLSMVDSDKLRQVASIYSNKRVSEDVENIINQLAN